MTFNKGRMVTGNTQKEGVYELSRYCSISNFSVIGGPSKLLSYFIRNNHVHKIYSYCDKRWNNGKLYEKLGMSHIRDTQPNYSYTKDCKNRLHRSRFQKHKLKDFENYDDNLTEEEIMRLEKYHRIYDCGSKFYAIEL